jgi:ubiquinone/menaquinone biosynthesis C-methylase UbiE
MKKPADDIARFHSVDQTANPTFFPQFMDAAHALPAAQNYAQEMMDHLELSSGTAILDVGCGTGRSTLDLARAVGAQGRVVGIDRSETMLQEARARATRSQLSVEYVLADATRLPFADASFDGCQASRVFGHLPEPALVLAEMVRVAKPGARIVVADGDLDLTAVEIADRALARKMIHAACDQMAQGWIGRQLPRLFKEARLSNIRVTGFQMVIDYTFFHLAFSGILQHALTAGVVSDEEFARFWNALEQAEQDQSFFASGGGFVVSGQKPG